jgi:MFS family permease
MNEASPTKKLFTFEFLALCLVISTAFCNISVFYSFYHYLEVIGIPVVWRGFLVGLEPMAAFVLRLFVLPLLHVRNVLWVTTVSLILLIFISCSYLWAVTVPAIIVLRVLHGAVFVLLTSAGISLIVHFIPKEHSGRGFSSLSVATILPYAVIPPAFETLLPFVRNEADLYAAVSVFSLAAILLLLAVRRRIGHALQDMDGTLMHRPVLSEIRENFSQKAVLSLLSAILLIYLAHATFFYFMKNLTLNMNIGDVGLFFIVSMAMILLARMFGTALFDRIDKAVVLSAILFVLIPCIGLMPHAATPAVYYLLAALYGMCMGIAMPLMNALLFSVSAPSLRGLNTNMTLFMMDMAYFGMPYLGGLLITIGMHYAALFHVAAGFVLLSLLFVLNLRRGRQGR